jgi:hypothetical protein
MTEQAIQKYSLSRPIKKSDVYHAYNLGVDDFKNALIDSFQACFDFLCFNDVIYETNTRLVVKDCNYDDLLTM